jgi:hypothetical protein
MVNFSSISLSCRNWSPNYSVLVFRGTVILNGLFNAGHDFYYNGQIWQTPNMLLA